MANSGVNEAVQYLRRAVLQGEAGPTDAQLLECFIASRDEAAFEAIVRRHGPMVWGVCRRVLRQEQDAQDAFQATFLVLARKAATVTPREMLANWLYGVACRTAMKVRGLRAKRQAREKQVTVMPDPPTVQRDDSGTALRPLLDQELSRLPNKYRVPVVLCDLEGKTQKAAAQQLGWPEGTVSSRLARARTMLARRLTRYGLGSSAGSLAAVLSQEAASASIPTALVASTVKAASQFAAGQVVAAGVASAEVAALTERVLRSMFLSRVTTVAAVVLMAVVLTTGTGFILAPASGSGQQEAKAARPAQPAKEEAVTATWSAVINTYRQNAALADEMYTAKQVTVTGPMRRVTRHESGRRGSVYYAVQMFYYSSSSLAGSRGVRGADLGRGGLPDAGGRGGRAGRSGTSSASGGTVSSDERPILSFEFGAEDRKQLATLNRNQTLTIEGQCEGMTVDATGGQEIIHFRNCKIVKVESPE